jgi:hypothetical protein
MYGEGDSLNLKLRRLVFVLLRSTWSGDLPPPWGRTTFSAHLARTTVSACVCSAAGGMPPLRRITK